MIFLRRAPLVIVDPLASLAQWAAPTWGIAGGRVFNTPPLGAESLTDGGVEVWTSPTDLTHWGEWHDGGGGVEREANIVHAGTYSVRYAGGNYKEITQSQARVNRWSRLSSFVRSEPSGALLVVCVGSKGHWGVFTVTIASEWAHISATGGGAAAGNEILVGRYPPYDRIMYADSLSHRFFTTKDLFATRRTRLANRNIITPPISVLTPRTQAGIVVALDDPNNALNHVIAYCDGKDNVRVEKCVNGVYTALANVSNAHGATKYFSAKVNGNQFAIYYGTTAFGTQIGSTFTINDTAILSARFCGLFSTDPGNQFNPTSVPFQVMPYA